MTEEDEAFNEIERQAKQRQEAVKANFLRPKSAQEPQRTEQNFCPRCGKRTPDLITIHTCTPPRENT
jgi:hypothetical protein